MTKPEFSNSTCDVCGETDDLSMVSSGIAPFTHALCKKCENDGSESIGVIALWLATYGGPDMAPESSQKLKSYIGGQPAAWEEIKEYYNANEASILASFEEEFSLEDDEEWSDLA